MLSGEEIGKCGAPVRHGVLTWIAARTMTNDEIRMTSETASPNYEAHTSAAAQRRVLPALSPAAMVCLCMFAAGWGPANYEVHIYGDYYIIRLGGNVCSLVRELPPVDINDEARRYEFVCEGIASYGRSGEIIYGTTLQSSCFVLNPPQPIHIFHDRQKWLEALDALGVGEPELIIPRPPEDEPRLVEPAFWWWCIGFIVFAFVMVLLLMLLLYLVRRKRAGVPGTHCGTC
jgi:hypothetical protein